MNEQKQKGVTFKFLVKLFLQKLSPEQYFLENEFIPKSHTREYENELKKELKSWADERKVEKVKQ